MDTAHLPDDRFHGLIEWTQTSSRALGLGNDPLAHGGLHERAPDPDCGLAAGLRSLRLRDGSKVGPVTALALGLQVC